MPDECLITAKSKPDPMTASARIGPPSRARQYSRRFSLKRRYPTDPKVLIQQECPLSPGMARNALARRINPSTRQEGTLEHQRFATEATNHYQDSAYRSTARSMLSTCATPCFNGAPGSKDPFERPHSRQLLHEHTPVQVHRPPSTLFHVKHQFHPVIVEHLRP